MTRDDVNDYTLLSTDLNRPLRVDPLSRNEMDREKEES